MCNSYISGDGKGQNREAYDSELNFGDRTRIVFFFFFLFLKGSKASHINTICYKFAFLVNYNRRFSLNTILRQIFFCFHISLGFVVYNRFLNFGKTLQYLAIVTALFR